MYKIPPLGEGGGVARRLTGFQEVIRRPGISIVEQLTESIESSFLIHQDVYHDSFVCP